MIKELAYTKQETHTHHHDALMVPEQQPPGSFVPGLCAEHEATWDGISVWGQLCLPSSSSQPPHWWGGGGKQKSP